MVQTTTRKTARPENNRLATSFLEWAAQEVDRLLAARAHAGSLEEKAQCELQLAVVCDAARRYGEALQDVAEL